MHMGSKGMDTEFLGSSSGNLAGKGSQKLGPWQEGDVEVKEGQVYKDRGGREVKHVCRLVGMVHQRWAWGVPLQRRQLDD